MPSLGSAVPSDGDPSDAAAASGTAYRFSVPAVRAQARHGLASARPATPTAPSPSNLSLFLASACKGVHIYA